MVLHEDLACFGCGTLGFTRFTCIFCPCLYCSGEHPRKECQKAPPCDNCGESSHRTSSCRRIQPQEIQVALLSKGQSFHIKKTPLLQRFNLSVQGPCHNDPEWSEIPEDTRDEVLVQETLTFPSLKTLCAELLQDIQDNLLPACQDLDYAEQVITHGGIAKVTEELLAHVRPEVLDLQGEQITRGNLERIRQAQNKDHNWNDPMGYLDFITDDRSSEWLRNYVGQCDIAMRRLISAHTQEILRASVGSLHYFVVWMGNGHRSINFIRLWTVPRDKTSHWVKVKHNLLESLFCKAFNSHFGILDGRTAEKCLQENFDPQHPSLGLNLMTPLAQCGFKLGFQRSMLVQAAYHTPDSQILYWLKNIRQKRIDLREGKVQRRLLAPRPIFRADFEQALRDALGGDNDLFQAVQASFAFEVESHWLSQPQTFDDSMPFFGTTSAHVGFILDYAAVSPASDSLQENPDAVPKFGIPWVLRKCNLNDTNCMLWTFNFHHFLPLGIEALASSKPKTNRCHLELIRGSQVRIVFLCGPRAEEVVCDSSMKRYTLELRGFQYPIYLAYIPSDSGIKLRLFIRCPPIPSQIWSSTQCDSSKFSEGLRFAISLLRLKGIRGYSIETMALLGTILSWARQEKSGKMPVEIDTMGPSVGLWLSRKGIGKKTLANIQQLAGGSLARGLLMILGSLERRPCKRKEDHKDDVSEWTVKKNRRDHGSFDTVAFKKVKKIVSSAQRDKEEAYQKTLNDLQPDNAYDSATIKNVAGSEVKGILMGTDDSTRKGPERIRDSARLQPEKDEHLEKNDKESGNTLIIEPSEQAVNDLLPDEAYGSATIKNALIESEVKEILMSTDHSTLKEQERIRDLISLQPEENEHLEEDDEESGKALDIKPSELISLGQDAIDQGILDPRVSQAQRVTNSSGYTWRKESSRFRNFEYRYQADPDRSRLYRTITLNRCHIGIDQFEDIGEGTIWVRIEISEPGQRHPQCYVPEARESDPVSRLAFKLRYQPSSGPEVTRFGHRSGFLAIYAGNTFVDILIEKKSYQEIAKTPRRYIFLGKLKECPDELKRFREGGYTDGCDLTGKEDSV